MRACLQRVKSSYVSVNGEIVASIGKGMNILLGIGIDDTVQDAQYLATKIAGLRIFDDEDGVMNLSLLDWSAQSAAQPAAQAAAQAVAQAAILVISQFTLYGDCRKGKRPSYAAAMPPDSAVALYEHFVQLLREFGYHVETGVFRAEMEVGIVNDGPVTLLLDSKKEF